MQEIQAASLTKQLLKRTAISFLFCAGVFFGAAGTWRWGAGWLFMAELYGCSLAIGLWLGKTNPQLLKERLSPIIQPDQESWDKVILLIAFLLFFLWLLAMPLDAVRFGISRMPDSLQPVGAIGLLVSFYVIFLVFRENSFTSPVVRIQEERGQRVVTTGPYRLVRHPMYAGALILLVSAPLLLKSWIGLGLSLPLIVLMGVRAVMEERLLSLKLPGYADYVQRVRYRFIPWVW